MRAPRLGTVLLLAASLWGGVSCAGLGGHWGVRREPFHLSALAEQGDPARRASVRLVLEGLDADAEGRPSAAIHLYERALQVDPTNPWAYLALARHRAEGLDPERALAMLDQAEGRLELEGPVDPRVEAHLLGLRGSVLWAVGRREEGADLLRRARRLAPRVWDDGRLDPWELR